MNLLHLKYAVEIAKSGSLGKAAEVLTVAQPNLSRAVKDLEADLGTILFRRTPKGMILTAEGERFIGYAKSILSQIEDLESLYRTWASEKKHFSLSAPRAGYISDAFSHFADKLDTKHADISYVEVSALQGIQNVVHGGYQLGIIRYTADHEDHFRKVLEEKGLQIRFIGEFFYRPIFRKDSPLAEKNPLRLHHLLDFIRIAPTDPAMPTASLATIDDAIHEKNQRRIFVEDRAGMFDLLAKSSRFFLWGAPVPQPVLKHLGLVQRDCIDHRRIYRDVLIYRKGRSLTATEEAFVRELDLAVQRTFPKEPYLF